MNRQQENIQTWIGTTNILLSAPHSVFHTRNGTIRSGEVGTDLLVKQLCHTENVYGIWKQESEENDANYDEKCEYKQHCISLVNHYQIACVFDIHGMRCNREEDICIGTGYGQNIQGNTTLTKQIQDIFIRQGFIHTTIDKPFSAVYENTVSAKVAKVCQIPCFQIEINSRFRNPKFDTCQMGHLVDTLSEIIHLVKRQLGIENRSNRDNTN